MMSRSRLAACAALALSLAGTAAAGADGTFIVTNASDYAVIAFQTGAKGVWSKDWIPGDMMMPGEQFQMQFSTGGDCVVPTMVTFEDNSTFDVDVDYCATNHLLLEHTTITAE
jgi:hypothetical protein